MIVRDGSPDPNVWVTGVVFGMPRSLCKKARRPATFCASALDSVRVADVCDIHSCGYACWQREVCMCGTGGFISMQPSQRNFCSCYELRPSSGFLDVGTALPCSLMRPIPHVYLDLHSMRSGCRTACHHPILTAEPELGLPGVCEGSSMLTHATSSARAPSSPRRPLDKVPFGYHLIHTM